jgi:hypothetical protein
MKSKPDGRDEFLSFSVILTGYDKAALESTGMTGPYYDTLLEAVGAAVADEMLLLATAIIKKAGKDEALLYREIKRQLFTSPRYGAICNSIVQLWYMGTWFALPVQWQTLYGEVPGITADRMVSTEAYQQGLIWDVIGAHPPGAKQPGFASWSFNPLTINK